MIMMSSNEKNEINKPLRKRKFTDKINEYKDKSRKNNYIENNILIININILDGISKNKHSSFINEYLRYEIKGKDFFLKKEKIIANGVSTGKIKNGYTNFDKRIDKIFRKELKANIIANIEKILEISQITRENREDTKGHTFADRFDRRNSIFNYKGQNYEVMITIGKKNNVNTLYSIENVKKTNKKT